MSDVLFDAVIGRLLADASIVASVGSRVYHGHVSTIPQPVYPCVSISRSTPARVDPNFPGEHGAFYVAAFSATSYEEAWDIASAVKAVLHNASGVNGGLGWQLKQRFGPVESVDTTAGTVYGYTAVYSVAQVG